MTIRYKNQLILIIFFSLFSILNANSEIVKKIDFFKTENCEEADCYLLNTCHIRDKAKEKVYHEIGRVKEIFKLKKNLSSLSQDVLLKLKTMRCLKENLT